MSNGELITYHDWSQSSSRDLSKLTNLVDEKPSGIKIEQMDGKGLEILGWEDFFEKAKKELLITGLSFARVTEVNKSSYRVSDGNHDMLAELSGKFLFSTSDSVDFPTVGDWVTIEPINDFSNAVVHAVLPRKTLLKRKDSGHNVEFQLIASNIDYGLILQPADHVSVNLMDRYFVMLNESGIAPIIVITKTDLVTQEQLEAIENKVSVFNSRTLFVSNMEQDGINVVYDILFPGKTYCLLGQSGVGKSSLLNRLLGTNFARVKEIREKDGRGRHTTVRRQLVCLESGSMFVDTPGIRELGNFQVDTGISKTFDEFFRLAEHCRYKNCSHTHEIGCAVIEAVENGTIDQNRYNNFLRLKKESDHYDMSYLDKRKKGKSLSKILKNYKKLKRDNPYN